MCTRCGGNLYVDENELCCLQCSRRAAYREQTEIGSIREAIVVDRSIDAVVPGRQYHSYGHMSGGVGRDGQ